MKHLKNSKKIGILCFFLLVFVIIMQSTDHQWNLYWLAIQDDVIKMSENMWIPGLYHVRYYQGNISLTEMIWKLTVDSQPYLSYLKEHAKQLAQYEDEETIAMILEQEANEENSVDENGDVIIRDDRATANTSAPEVQNVINPEELKDFDYLLSHFYLVDSTTSIDDSQLNYDELMSRDMKINTETDGPKVLIYHTHSQEAFADSTPGDPSTSIVGIGSYLTELLNAKGIATLHDEGVYDMIDGQLDRSMAYDYAKDSITQILSENPSIEVVIDLHRDGVGEDTHLVTEINGKQTARIMFFNGLSRSSTSGDIDYLYNPYIQDNLSFSFQMQLACETMYPGWARRIYLRAYRYNLHLMPKNLLIEAGAQTNSVEEMRNAMELLANSLSCVLIG